MPTKNSAPGPLETLVRLRRGNIARTVSIALTTRLEGAHPAAGSRIFEAFTQGVDAWLTRPEKVRLNRATVSAHPDRGLFVETWEASFPRMPPSAFAMLARMAAASVAGATRLEVREHADLRTLVVRDLDDGPEATILDVPWQIGFVGAVEPDVRIVFADPIAVDTVRRVGLVLQAWADVLGLGGFPGGDGQACSAGEISGVDATAERELVLRFRRLVCGYDAWEALFEALAPVNDEVSIERVEIRGGQAASTAKPAASGRGIAAGAYESA